MPAVKPKSSKKKKGGRDAASLFAALAGEDGEGQGEEDANGAGERTIEVLLHAGMGVQLMPVRLRQHKATSHCSTCPFPPKYGS